MKLTKELKENIDLYLKTKTPKELLHLFKKYGIEEIPKQLILSGVVSSFLDNLKDSDSKALLDMKELNESNFIDWCKKHPYAGVDDEWDNEVMFMRDVAKYIESRSI
jgi:hypothetical protein